MPTPELPKDPSANSRESGGDWVAEARWWEEIRVRIERERGRETVPPKMSWEKWIMTTFESVEALWEDKYKVWRPRTSENDGKSDDPGIGFSTTDVNPYKASESLSPREETDSIIGGTAEVEPDVDETMLSSQALSQLMAREEEEWGKEVQDRDEPELEDQYPEEDEELIEEGPLPDLQAAFDDVKRRERCECYFSTHRVLIDRLFQFS